MDNTKKTTAIEKLVYLLLIIFPFGQLLRSEVLLGDFLIVIHPLDIVVGVIFLVGIFNKFWKKVTFNPTDVVLVLIFTLLFSLSLFTPSLLTEGAFYLIRFIAYLYLPFIIISKLHSARVVKLLFNSLLFETIIIAIFGWIQYIFYSDLRPLYFIGWDDHLYRLAGSFLDPGFTSILLTFGAIFSLVCFVEKRKIAYLFSLIFLCVTLAFTYSRAGYIALVIGVLYYLFKVGKLKLSLILISIFAGLIFILPRPSSEGVKLERMYSLLLRIQNYRETLVIWQKSPVFGIGFNNICVARQAIFHESDSFSHSCSGSDSSLLLLLSTSGMVGVVIFTSFIFRVRKYIKDSGSGLILKTSFVALVIHSVFVNSFFYPWVLAYMGILLAINLGSISKNVE